MIVISARIPDELAERLDDYASATALRGEKPSRSVAVRLLLETSLASVPTRKDLEARVAALEAIVSGLTTDRRG
jgi:metal-responsive CopG/Arc/MetJ family transcriptional regulator